MNKIVKCPCGHPAKLATPLGGLPVIICDWCPKQYFYNDWREYIENQLNSDNLENFPLNVNEIPV